MRPTLLRRMRQSLLAPAVATTALAGLVSGCTVVTVAGTAVSVTASAVGLAADAAVGTVKIVGKGVGMAADAVTGGSSDNSGIQVHESIRPAGS